MPAHKAAPSAAADAFDTTVSSLIKGSFKLARSPPRFEPSGPQPSSKRHDARGASHEASTPFPNAPSRSQLDAPAHISHGAAHTSHPAAPDAHGLIHSQNTRAPDAAGRRYAGLRALSVSPPEHAHGSPAGGTHLPSSRSVSPAYDPASSDRVSHTMFVLPHQRKGPSAVALGGGSTGALRTGLTAAAATRTGIGTAWGGSRAEQSDAAPLNESKALHPLHTAASPGSALLSVASYVVLTQLLC